jgi:hypothetical protein
MSIKQVPKNQEKKGSVEEISKEIAKEAIPILKGLKQLFAEHKEKSRLLIFTHELATILDVNQEV